MKIIIPTQLKKIFNNLSELQINIGDEKWNVGMVIDALCKEYPSLEERLFGKDNKINKFINIFVNDEDIRFLDNLQTEIKNSDVITILPSIAGG